MDAVVAKQPFNAAQMLVLRSFANVKAEKDREKLTSLYLDFLQKKLEEATDKWWEENEVNDEKIEEVLNSHYRTPYK